MSRFEELIAIAEEHQELAAENYARIRRLAEDLRAGLCDWMDARDGICVRLVPPVGPFQPKSYGDEVFSLPPRGFRPLGPIAFGLAMRVSRGTDWIRLTFTAHKIGDRFRVEIQGGPSHDFDLPLSAQNPEPFYALIFFYVTQFFRAGIADYREGEYSQREIGFDFSDEDPAPAV